jgi:hydroxymethylbilane synthase
LARLNRLEEICDVFPSEILLPAVGQGALGLVARSDDSDVRSLLARLDHPPSHQEVLAERGLLAALEAGCRAPVAARARVASDSLELSAGVFSEDGKRSLRDKASGSALDAEALGRSLAGRLLERGAAELISGDAR